jgi:hypothetical protein
MSNQEQNGDVCMPSSSATSLTEDTKPTSSTSNTSSGKRNFLEVNDLDKYKNLLLNKPFETKRLKPSEALDRVRQFLPNFKQSTEKLLDEHKERPDEVNIENVEDEAEHIEMNLALIPESGSDSNEDDSDEEEEEEDDEEESENEGPESSPNSVDDLKLGFKARDPNRIKKLKLGTGSKAAKARNMIQIIDNGDNDGTNTSSSNVEAGASTSGNNGNDEDDEDEDEEEEEE